MRSAHGGGRTRRGLGKARDAGACSCGDAAGDLCDDRHGQEGVRECDALARERDRGREGDGGRREAARAEDEGAAGDAMEGDRLILVALCDFARLPAQVDEHVGEALRIDGERERLVGVHLVQHAGRGARRGDIVCEEDGRAASRGVTVAERYTWCSTAASR